MTLPDENNVFQKEINRATEISKHVIINNYKLVMGQIFSIIKKHLLIMNRSKYKGTVNKKIYFPKIKKVLNACLIGLSFPTMRWVTPFFQRLQNFNYFA